ncbi:hypothetical protein QTH90_26295 [Variovorax sp. J2P1-59]|nr:hypothetical protein [Variovorax sp. J2P1-59]MDM0077948.1 hypothetical protein [Variovorax sp. J2P1-59]
MSKDERIVRRSDVEALLDVVDAEFQRRVQTAIATAESMQASQSGIGPT